MKLNTLSIIAGILFVISLFVYQQENHRGTDLVSGSDYIKGLDINKIQKIILRFKNDKKISFSRDSNQFVLENHKSYPAATDKVNDLIYKIAGLQVKEKVASRVDQEGLKKYELDDKNSSYQVELYDNNGKKTVSFKVGKSYKGKGNYLYKEGLGDVYLSKESLWLNSSYKDFIDRLLVDIKETDIEKLSLSTDKKIELVKKDNEFALQGDSAEKFKKEKAKEFVRGLTNIRFNDFYKHDEGEVKGLAFDKGLKVQLKSKLIYNFQLAQKKEDHFLKINALVDEIPRQVTVSSQDGKEKLQTIEEMVKAQGNAQKLNLEKGSWVYKVDKSTYEKIAKKSKFFF